MRISRLVRSVSSAIVATLVWLTLLAMATSSQLGAQAKPMTILSFNGMTLDQTSLEEDCWGDDCSTYRLRSYHLNFTIKNTTDATYYLYVASSCSPYCPWGLNPSGMRASLSPGQTTSLNLYIQVPDYASGSTPISLSVAAAVGTGWYYNPSTGTIEPTGYQPIDPWDSFNITINVANGVVTLPPTLADYRPAVTPKATTEVVPFNASLSRSFTIQNAGIYWATYTLTATCGNMTACTPSKTSTTLPPGGTDVATVSFTTPGTVNTTNAVNLIATFVTPVNPSIADTGSRPTVTPPVRVTVSPKNGTPLLTQGSATASFLVGNTGAYTDAFTYTPICEGWATNCAIADVTPIDDPNFAFRVKVSFQTPATEGSPTYPAATVRLVAKLGVTADTGSIPTLLGYSTLSMTPRTTTVTDPANTLRSGGITVTNNGNAVGSYTADLSCPLTSCYLGGNLGTSIGFTLQPGASTMVGASYTARDVGQAGTIRFVVTRQSPPNAIMKADTAWITSTASDVYAPTITLSGGVPSEGATVIGALFSVTMDACDADGQLGAPIVTLNGVALSTAVASSSYSLCHTLKSGTYPIVAKAGANTLSLSVSDGYHTTTVTRHFTYDEAYEARPIVTAQVATELLRGGQQWADTFFVRNPGPITIPYALTTSCTSQLVVCTASQPTVTVGPGQTAKIAINYTVGTVSPVGYVGPITSYTSTSGTTVHGDAVLTRINVDQFAPTATISGPMPGSTINVLPTIGVQWCDADGSLATHVVTIDGVPLTDTFASQAQSGCSTAGGSSWTSVPITLGAHTIAATATDAVGHVTTSTLSFAFALPPVADYQPRVTPRTASAFLIPDEQTLTFAVRNAGTRTALYQLTPSCAPVAIAGSCRVDRQTLTLSPGITDSARVSFSILGLPTVAATPALIATYQDLAGRTSADTGRVSGLVPTIAQLYQPLVSDAGSYAVNPSDAVQVIVAFAFPVKNTGAAPVTYHADINITNNAYGFAPWARPDTAITVNPGQTQYAMVQPLVPAGTRTWADIAYTARYTSPANATVSSTGHGYIVPMIVTYGVEVTPKNQTATWTSGVPNQLDVFVRSTGNTSFGATATISCSGFVTVCQGIGNPNPQAVSITVGGSTPIVVPVGYSIDSTRGRSGTIKVSVRGQGTRSAYADSATFTIVSNGPYVAVTVSPDSILLPVPTGVDIIQHFDITSTGTQASQFDYAVTCTGAASCSSITNRTTALSHLEKQTVTVTYHTGATLGAPGTVRLIASSSSVTYASDTGVVAIRTDQMAPIAVHTMEVNPGANVTRGQCIAIAAGDNAAYECGDLRIAHALPATTTMNKTRAPVLVYNSAHAVARGIVSANVVAAPGFYPTSLHATLQFVASGKTVDLDSIPWLREYSDSRQRRIAVQFDARALGLTTPDQPVGAFAYKLLVCSRDTNYPAPCASDTGTVVVIDRTSSIFGKGWWVDGLEQLSFITPAPNQVLWAGGDGTTRLYTQQQQSLLWLVTPTLDRVDSLTLAGDTYTRHLPNNARVEFNTGGRQTATVNTQGHRTKFVWSAALDKLNAIKLPVPSTPASAQRTYQLSYYAAAGGLPPRLKVVTAPSDVLVRQTTLTYTNAPDGSKVVSSIADPDHSAVTFGYDARGRLASRTDRRQKTTTYFYDEANGLQRSVVATAPENIVRAFCAAETAGLTACAPPGLDTTQVMTWFDGPRSVPDTTWFRITPFGAPSLIIDANHDVTRIARRDTRWPLLVTNVVDARGHIVAATYDARGLVATMTDSNGTTTSATARAPATTTYLWDTKWDHVTRVVSPTGVVTRTIYDANGDRTWQYVGDADTMFVRFGYDPITRLVTTVTTPQSTVPTRYDYDAQGNHSKVTTSRGVVSESLKDALGRDTLVKTPTDSLQTESLKLLHRVVYDAADRDSVTKEWNASDSLVVEQRYDAEGNVIEVIQRGQPDDGSIGPVIRRFAYDDAGRKISERLVHGSARVEEEVLHWTYDPAGNLITGGRDAFNATLSYDRLNRLLTRSGTTSASYTYDASGLRTANNEAAQIGRSYYLNGLIESDTLRIANADWSPGGAAHTYVLHYTYDSSGRRTAIDHPSQLAGGGTTARTTYGYDQTTGLLSTITDKFGQIFQYRYDAASRLRSLVSRAGSPNPVTERRSYDPDSRLARRTVATWANDTLHDDVFDYDARDKVLRTSHDHFEYDIRGRTKKSVLGSITETMRLDAFGNALESNTLRGRPGADWSTYEPGSGRLRLRMAIGQTGIDDTTSYDIDLRGNTYHTRQLVASGAYLAPNGQSYEFLTHRSNSDDTFDDRAKLVSHTLTFDTLFHQTIYSTAAPARVSDAYQSQELYRYDALGRRVWTRSIKGPTCNSSSGSPDKWTGCHNTLTRTIWDGDQILYEVRVDGSADASAAALEDDGPNTIFGGIIGYVHGYGIDEPVALDKNGVQVLPIADWRGHFDLGICGAVRCPSTQIKFPQRNVFGAANWAGNLPAPSWYGGLIEGQVDASGYVYQRNRYLDPSTGRFTQEDPMGLAGGMNLYGFASGDPVNFSDPFGLFECDRKTGEGCTAEFKRLLRIDKPLEDPGLADPVALAAGGFIGAPAGEAGGAAITVVSKIAQSRALTKVAQALEGEVQGSIDRLTAKLAQGNLNPGIGTRFLFNGIFEARARDGARVYFRNASNNVIEILAKSTKTTQEQVIRVLQQIYK